MRTNEPMYQVRRLQPADAPGVRALVQRVYGTTYAHPELYNPEALLQLNDCGKQVSAVAVDAAGLVVGHYALERPDLGPVAETGEAMILPEHRGQHLFQRLRAFLEDEARQLGLFGLCGRPLTSHVLSQKVYQQFHCHPTGIELARFGDVVNDLSPAVAEPLSLLMYFKFLDAPPPAVYHLPARHHALTGKIAERMGRTLTFQTSAPATGTGQLDTEFEGPTRAAFIRVRRIGSDSAAEIDRAQAALFRQGAHAVFLRLPLAQPGAAEVCLAVERRGFYFSGIDPRPAAEGDVLQLQLLNVPIDPAALHIDEPFAQEIVAYVFDVRQRVAP